MFEQAELSRLADGGCPWTDGDGDQEAFFDFFGDDFDGVAVLRMIDDGCPHNPEDYTDA